MTAEQATTFGGQLQRYRARAGLTQEALAERAGLTASAISALERGARRLPYLHTRQQLAEALGLSAEERDAFVLPQRRASDDRAPSLPADRPPPTNLPAERTPLIGRAGEAEALLELVLHDHARLLTLTGVGGCGKTRLALHVAADVWSG